MAFTWVNYDESFLKEILEKSELDSQQRADLHDALKNNDKDVLISIMCSICSVELSRNVQSKKTQNLK